jgi:hypothetical protein
MEHTPGLKHGRTPHRYLADRDGLIVAFIVIGRIF